MPCGAVQCSAAVVNYTYFVHLYVRVECFPVRDNHSYLSSSLFSSSSSSSPYSTFSHFQFSRSSRSLLLTLSHLGIRSFIPTMRSAILSLAACASTALATQGFNYGAVKIDGSIKVQSDFQSEFSTAKALSGTNGDFASARLYTTIVRFLSSAHPCNGRLGAQVNIRTASWLHQRSHLCHSCRHC